MTKGFRKLLCLAGLLAVIPACTQTPAANRSPSKEKPIKATVRTEKVPTDVAAEHGDFEDFTSSSCGVERWSVKTGTDSGAKSINITSSTATTLATLIKIKPPGSIPSNSRVKGTETTNWQIHVTLVEYKLESDSDYHLVIKVGTGTMIAEIPSPSCVGSTSPFKADITATRTAFDKKYHVTSSWHTANVPVILTGIGFFDYKHGQTGVAPNAIEIHPLLGITFGAAPRAPFAMTITPSEMSISQGRTGFVTVGTAVNGKAGPPHGLRVLGLPRGVKATFGKGTWSAAWPASSPSLPGRLYPTRVTFEVARSVSPGDYVVRIYGSGPHSTLWTQFVLTVVDASSQNFYLAATPATFDVARGHTGSLRINVVPINGYSGATYPAINGLPPGVSATMSPALVNGRGSFVIHVSVSRNAVIGTHAVTVGAAGGSQSHIILLALHVTA